MAPPRKHDTDQILDAARTIALRDGPRATSVAAIAHESGAPAGTLYHRFGSRDGLLQAAWLRALDRFRTEVLGAASEPGAEPTPDAEHHAVPAPAASYGARAEHAPAPGGGGELEARPAPEPGGEADAVEVGVAMAVAAVRFARRWADDARLLAVVRRGDLLDGGPDPDFQERLAAMNAPLVAALGRVAAGLGRTTAQERERVVAAIVDLPEAAVRRHTRDGRTVPSWLEESIAASARRLLTEAVEPVGRG